MENLRKHMVLSALAPLILATAEIFIGLFATFLFFKNTKEKAYLGYGLFLISAGMSIIFVNFIPRWILPDKVLVFYVAMYNLFFCPVPFFYYTRHAFGESDSHGGSNLVKFFLAYIGILLGWGIWLGNPILGTVPAWMIGTCVCLLFALYLPLKKAFGGDMDAKIFAFGMLILLFCVVVDMLVRAGYLPYQSNMLFNFGLAAFAVAMGVILIRRFGVVHNQLEVYAVDLRDRHEKATALANELQLSNLKLKEMDQLKDSFLANTSHELRPPLNGIIGISDSLAEGAVGALPPEAVRNIRLIADSGRRLSHLVNDILDLSRLKHSDINLSLNALKLGPVVDLVLTLIKPKAKERNLELTADISEDIPFIKADENRLSQILLNLVGNAAKFTENGRVTVGAVLKDEMVEIFVTDTGIGIHEDDQHRIFNEFEQADGSISRDYGGTGLGLSISKKLVDLHGGRIGCHSVLGQGSKFYFTIPIASGQDLESLGRGGTVIGHMRPLESAEISERALTARGASEPHSHTVDHALVGVDSNSLETKKWRVLAVDDEPVNLQVIENFLKLAQFEVLSCGDPLTALEIVKTYPKFDAIVLDLMMPKMSGFELCRLIREVYPANEVPVLFLTARNQISDLISGFESGGNDYLVKPLSRTELVARLKSHIDFRQMTLELVSMREQRARADKDMEAARAVQQILFPERLLFPNLEIAVVFSPAEKTGWDWYTGFYDSDNHMAYLFMGDVTGHGFPSALLTGLACGAVSSAMNLVSDELRREPERVLLEIARVVNRVLIDSGGRSGRGMTMVGLALDTLSGKTWITHFGHPTSILVAPDSAKLAGVPGPILGVESNLNAEVKEFRLQKGDQFFLYTDGVFENLIPDTQSSLKRKVRSILCRGQESPEQTARDIVTGCHGFLIPVSQRDDSTFLLVRWSDKASFVLLDSASMPENLIDCRNEQRREIA